MISRVLRLIPLCARNNRKDFHSSSKLLRFYETDRKAGYEVRSDYVEEPKNLFQRIWEGSKQFSEEMEKFKDEMRELFSAEPKLYQTGDIVVQFKFDGDPKVLEKWIVSCDSDCGEGMSVAKLELTPNGTGLFTGVLDTTPIRDGRKVSSGYCNLGTVRPLKSFYRDDVHNWELFTHLILRVRGDGRQYMLNLHVDSTFDLMWNDLHHYIMFTRGGPYWQYVKIPLSKFFLSNRGRIQDIQYRVFTDKITGISITAADGIPGEFALEIDFIGVECDPTFHEDFAYEQYKTPFPHYI